MKPTRTPSKLEASGEEGAPEHKRPQASHPPRSYVCSLSLHATDRQAAGFLLPGDLWHAASHHDEL